MLENEIKDAVAQLRRSNRGRRVMRDFIIMLDNELCCLDSANKKAFTALVTAALNGSPATVRDAILAANKEDM